MAQRLARAGYGGGDPEKVLKMRMDFVLGALHYLKFESDYESKLVDMMRPK